jgi:diguanylate cyclase (GGDEF)-like protein/PAS domain S-box-containing protein
MIECGAIMKKNNSGFLALGASKKAERRSISIVLMALLVVLPVLGIMALEKEALHYPGVMIAMTLIGLLLMGCAAAERRRTLAALTYVGRLEREVAAKTEEVRLTHQILAAKERQRRTLVDAAPVGIAELDARGYCRYLNPVGCVLTACDEEAARGRHIFEFVHPDDRDYVEFVWQLNATHEEANWLEFRLRHSDSWIAAHWVNLFAADRRPLGSIMIFIDNTAQRRKDERIWTQAHYDALTGLPNRCLFWERLAQSLLRAKRDHHHVAVLWIDLDGFKAINDRWGHATGDELLQQAALRMNGRMRDSDTVARMGGDEFAVILPGLAGIDAAELVGTDLTSRLAEPFALRRGAGRISASIGVALYPRHAEDAETLVRYADMAMYAAKYAGKNRVTVWRPAFERRSRQGEERGFLAGS